MSILSLGFKGFKARMSLTTSPVLEELESSVVGSLITQSDKASLSGKNICNDSESGTVGLGTSGAASSPSCDILGAKTLILSILKEFHNDFIWKSRALYTTFFNNYVLDKERQIQIF